MDEQATKGLRPFLRRVRKKYAPVRVILFGSRARGDARPDSDYDLLLVSPCFETMDFHDRHVAIYNLQREPIDIDVICLTPKELSKRQQELSIVGQAAREGIELAA